MNPEPSGPREVAPPPEERAAEWLRQQQKVWVESGWLTPEGQQGLAELLADAQPKRRVLAWVMGLVGVACLALGVILVFAHHWANWGEGVRVALAMLPTLLLGGLGAWVAARHRDHPGWAEATSLGLWGAHLAGLALISQTYQLPGSVGGLFAISAALLAPWAWVLRAVAPLLAVAVAAVVWAWDRDVGERGSLVALAVAGVVALPLARRWLVVTSGWGARAMWLTLFGGLAGWLVPLGLLERPAGSHEAHRLGLVGAWAVLLVVWGRPDERGAASVARLLGRFMLSGLLLAATWEDFWRHREAWDAAHVGTVWIGGLLLVASTVLGQRQRSPGTLVGWVALGLVAAGLVPMAAGTVEGEGMEAVLAVAANGAVVLWVAVLLHEAASSHRLVTLNHGLFVIAILLWMRFVDSTFGLLERGVALAVLGLLILGANAWWWRRSLPASRKGGA